MEDVRAILNDFMNGVNDISKEEGMTVQAFMSLQNAAFEASALDVKTKELISVGIAAYNRCKYCIVVHVYNAYQAGATRQEILDAAMVAAGGFGAGPSMAYSSTYLLAAVNEFEHDFDKYRFKRRKNLQLWMSWRFLYSRGTSVPYCREERC